MKKFALIFASLALAACASETTAPSHEASTQEMGRNVAESMQLGRPVRLYNCGGQITLNQADNGDLAVKLEDVNTNTCSRLVVTDHTSGRIIREYDIRGSSYTLSNSMLSDLSDDCQVDFQVSHPSGYRSDRFIVYYTRCVPHASRPNQQAPRGTVGYQLSRNHNCKLMINGAYSGRNVDNTFCEGAHGDDIVSYEFSRNGNCKRMINGDYSNVNVNRTFCQ